MVFGSDRFHKGLDRAAWSFAPAGILSKTDEHLHNQAQCEENNRCNEKCYGRQPPVSLPVVLGTSGMGVSRCMPGQQGGNAQKYSGNQIK